MHSLLFRYFKRFCLAYKKEEKYGEKSISYYSFVWSNTVPLSNVCFYSTVWESNDFMGFFLWFFMHFPMSIWMTQLSENKFSVWLIWCKGIWFYGVMLTSTLGLTMTLTFSSISFYNISYYFKLQHSFCHIVYVRNPTIVHCQCCRSVVYFLT